MRVRIRPGIPGTTVTQAPAPASRARSRTRVTHALYLTAGSRVRLGPTARSVHEAYLVGDGGFVEIVWDGPDGPLSTCEPLTRFALA